MNWFRFVVPSLAILAAVPGGAEPSPAGAGVLVIANQTEHTVLIVDLATQREIAKVPVGINDHEVTVSKDGKLAYVPIYSNTGVGLPGTDGRSIDVVDLETRKLVRSIDLGKPVRPHKAQWGPDGMLYVTAELANAVDVVDPNAGKVVAEIPTGQPESHMIVLSPDGKRGYTANVGPGSVSVLDLDHRKLITVVPVSKRVQRISISNDGKWVFTHDQSSPRIAVIDTASNKIADWIEVSDVGYASTPTPDGARLLAVSAVGKLFVIDLKTLKVEKTLAVPRTAAVVTIRPDGAMAYISCPGEGKISVVDLKKWKVEEPISLTPGVDGAAWLAEIK